jgi:MFS family permease
MAVGAAHGITIAFNIPAWQVLTPRLVPRAELTRAIHLNGIAFNLARVVGPGLGGVLMGIWGPAVLFVVNALSFVAVLVAVAGTPDAPAPPRDGTSAWDRTREAARYVFHNRGPFRIFLAMVFFSMLAAPLMRMLPVFAADVYDAANDPVTRALGLKSVDLYGVMLSMMGLGAVAGGIALKLIPPWYPKHHFIPLSVFLGGVCVAVFSAVDSVAPAAIAIFFCGVFWLWSFNTSMAAIQMLVDDRMRGRVLAICNTAVFGAMPLGSLVAGYLGHYAAHTTSEGPGAQVGVGVLAVVLAVVGLVMLIWRTPEIDGLQPGETGFERRPGLLRGITASGHRPAR